MLENGGRKHPETMELHERPPCFVAEEVQDLMHAVPPSERACAGVGSARTEGNSRIAVCQTKKPVKRFMQVVDRDAVQEGPFRKKFVVL